MTLAVETGATSADSTSRSLFWTVPITLLGTAIFTWEPAIPATGIPTAASRLATYGLLALGLWLGIEKTNLTPRQRRATWLTIMVPYTLWFAVAWSAAINGFFRPDLSAIPRLPLAIFLPLLIALPLLLLSKRMGQILDAIPPSWLIALQLYRVFGATFLAAGLAGSLTPLFALPAGIGDMLTGLFALPAAMAVANNTARGTRTAILWNIFGLADFVLAITLGATTSPGPFQLIVPTLPSIGAGAYPSVLTPAFVVPSSILLHALSLRQLRRRRTAAIAADPVRIPAPSPA